MKKKIVVAMSGGVDSTTVAKMLHDSGYEVIGVTLQLYDDNSSSSSTAVAGRNIGTTTTTNTVKKACCAGQDIYDAQMAADQIGIAHYVLNYKSIFSKEVIENFVDSYTRGETPIPCINCNQTVKFRDLFKVAKDLGADGLATGHYAQKKLSKFGNYELHKGFDSSKDQSYFLFSMNIEQLLYTIFPLGAMTKKETRALAMKYGLNVADKQDSQDICFVPDGDYRHIIQKYRPNAFVEGDIVDTNGIILGKHNGIVNYTIGQRKGLGIASQNPLYVIRIEPDTNTIIVGQKEDLSLKTFIIKSINWLSNTLNEKSQFDCKVKIRSSAIERDATIRYISHDKAEVTLYGISVDAITPGQACVMYDDTHLLGGGWISRNHHEM